MTQNIANKEAVGLNDEFDNRVGVQYPLSVNGDSVYCKDIDVLNSIMGDFSGVPCDLVNDLETVIENDTTDNPKVITIAFKRTIFSNFIGIGCGSGNFSNVRVELLGSGDSVRQDLDDRDNDTKYTSRKVEVGVPDGFNKIRIYFYTEDPVCMSNLTIQKTTQTTGRIQARSELTGKVEDINSFRGALNVSDALVHKLGVNEYFTRDAGATTTLAVASVIDDTSITVVDSTGFVISDKIRITQNGIREVGIIFITNVVGNVITLDRPLSNDFPIGTNVIEVDNNLTSLAGTITSPISYRITPPAGQIWQITRVLTSMTDAGPMDDDKFGSLSPLTNGVVGRALTTGGRLVNISNWKDNSDLVNDMYDVTYTIKTPAGNYALRGRWTFTNAQFIVELDGDEEHYLELLVQDNLTAMDNIKIKAQGRIFGG